MNNLNNQESVKRRKRIPFTSGDSVPAFSENRLTQKLHDLEVRCGILEERNAKLTGRIEKLNLQMQQSESAKVKVQNKIRGVLQHVKNTTDQTVIPGAPVLENSIEQQAKLLKWKLEVIEKYLAGIFPEFYLPGK